MTVTCGAMSTATTSLKDEPNDVADLPGGGEADNVAVAGQWANPALMETSPDSNGVGRVRSMPGLLGVLGAWYLPKREGVKPLALAGRGNYPGSLNQLHSSSAQDRLANQIWGDGD